MLEFFKWSKEIRYENGISSSLLGNMDETPLFLNMTFTKILIKKGSRQVTVKTKIKKKQVFQ